MNWQISEIQIAGDHEFLEEIERIVDEGNIDEYNNCHISKVLDGLHMNSRISSKYNVFWTKAVFNRSGKLVITEYYGNFRNMFYSPFADMIQKAYPDKVRSVNRKEIAYR